MDPWHYPVCQTCEMFTIIRAGMSDLALLLKHKIDELLLYSVFLGFHLKSPQSLSWMLVTLPLRSFN